jgi:dUTP pyrophosphatase
VAESVDVLIVAKSVPPVAHPGDAGADLCSSEAFTLHAGERRTVATGVSIALPRGYVAFIVPRSGLAARHGITIVNSPGTVDAGYRGEISVTLLNTDSTESFDVKPGDRIAQMVVLPFCPVNFVPVEYLPGSERGTDGFGSTGVSGAPNVTKGLS